MPWFKFDHETPEKQQVLEIAAELQLSRAHVIGALCILWRWFSEQTVSGQSRDNPGIIDIVSETPGLGAQLERVGWLIRGGGTMQIPGFERWLGSAHEARRRNKNRILARENGGNGTVPGQERDSPADVRPQTQTQTQIQTQNQKKNQNPPTPRGGTVERPEDVPIPEVLFDVGLQDWIQHRRALRKPPTAIALRRLIAKLLRWGPERSRAAIAHSLEHSWDGVYEPKEREAVNGRRNGHPTETPLEQRKREGLERMVAMSNAGGQA